MSGNGKSTVSSVDGFVLTPKFGAESQGGLVAITLNDTPIDFDNLSFETELGKDSQVTAHYDINEAAHYQGGPQLEPIRSAPTGKAYIRQFRMAEQLADAINQIDGTTASYQKAHRALHTLKTDIRAHGLELFGKRRAAHAFLNDASRAITESSHISVQPYATGTYYLH